MLTDGPRFRGAPVRPRVAVRARDAARAVAGRARAVAILVGLMWVIAAVEAVLPGRALAAIGIHPRDLARAWQVPFAPFIHADFWHLLANTGPLLWLGAMVSVWGVADLAIVTGAITVLGGAGTWVIGRAAVHHGGSLLAFGFMGYLVARGLVERRVLAVGLALLTVYWYGSAVRGILPGAPSISWESHLSGLLAGILTGYVAARGSGPRV